MLTNCMGLIWILNQSWSGIGPLNGYLVEGIAVTFLDVTLVLWLCWEEKVFYLVPEIHSEIFLGRLRCLGLASK